MQFGPYKLIERLATGGMGEVFLAKLQRDAGFEKILAIKRILPHLSKDPAFVEMFNNEARLAANLNHQNIVQIFDFGEIGGTSYIAMEHVRGVDLRELLAICAECNIRIPPGLVLKIGMQCCKGLQTAHTARGLEGEKLGIVHRDVSPQNILISYAGEVKLTDFGLAKVLELDSVSGTIKGKFAYMSPEQVRGGEIALQSDIFSLGAVLYECFSGSPPYDLRLPARELLDAIAESRFPPLAEVAPGVPAPIAAIVAKAMEPGPSNRFPSALAMKNELDRSASELQLDTSSFDLGDFVKKTAGSRTVNLAEVDTDTEVCEHPVARGATATEATPAAQSGQPPAQGSIRHTQTWMRAPQGGRAAVALRWIMAVVLLAGLVAAILYYVELRESVAPSSPIENRAGADVAQQEVSVAFGRLMVRTDPAGAAVAINGRQLNMVTPTSELELEPAVYTLSLTRDGFEPAQFTVRVRQGALTDIHRTLVALPEPPGSLEITTEPQGAVVWLDGRRIEGTTPTRIAPVTAGTHPIRIEKSGYRTVEKKIGVKPGETRTVFTHLEPLRSRVLLQRKPVFSLEVGTHRTVVRREGAFKLKMRIGAWLNHGTVTLVATPFGQVSFDGKAVGVTPLLDLRLAYGRTHTFQITDQQNHRTTLLVRMDPPR